MSKLGRRCACRGVIEADPADPDDIERAVQEHQTELQHRAWRAGAVLRGEYLPTAEEARVGITTATKPSVSLVGRTPLPRPTLRRTE